MMTPLRGFATRLAVCALILLAMGGVVRAHDVPEEIAPQAWVRPEGSALQVLLRVPLLAVADVNMPKDGPGYLAMRYLDPSLREAANQISTGVIFLENGERLSQFEMTDARISLPSDRSFDTYEGALGHVRGPKLPDSTQLYYNQGYLDLELRYPIRSANDEFGVQVLLARGLANRTVTFVNYVRADGELRAFRLLDQTDLVRLDPTRTQASSAFISKGFFRFLDGVDHLLFIIMLALPFRRVREVVWPIASFAVAHTLTLTFAAFGGAPASTWFATVVAVLIALSIVYVAIENAVGSNLRRRWLVAFVFGIVHGFGFAFAFREALQFAGGHPVAALLSFNLGLELGQIIILSIAVPTFTLLFTQAITERAGTLVMSILTGHAAWHWMADRFGALELMSWPTLDLVFLASLVRWLLMLVIAGGGVWFLAGALRRKPGTTEMPEESIVDRPSIKA
jgi:HupE / UreJ protein